MKYNTIGVLLTAVLGTAVIALPESVQADWSGDIEGGTVIQGDGQGSLVRFKMSNSERPLNQQFYADWVRGSGGSNSYKVGYEPQYWLTDQIYAFGDASLRTAKVEDIDQQTNLLAGLGIQLLNTATTSLYAEAGAGQTSTKFRTAGALDQDVDSTVARFGASQVLTDFFWLELDGDYSKSDEVKRTTGEAGISFGVSGGGAIKYTYRVRSTDVAGQEAIETTDSFVSFNYGF